MAEGPSEGSQFSFSLLSMAEENAGVEQKSYIASMLNVHISGLLLEAGGAGHDLPRGFFGN